MDFKVRLADLNIAISSQFDYMQTFCKDYLIDEQADVEFKIACTMDEIRSENDFDQEHVYTDEYLETLAIQRKISEIIPNYQRILMHGACISFNHKGYFFTAPSGTGKSTHINLWHKYLKDYVDIVNGDKPFVSVEQKGEETLCKVYGTPWAGKEGWHKNHSVEFGAICIVARGKVNTIRKVAAKDYVNYLMKQTYIPKDPMAFVKVLELLNLLLKHVPIYYLECDMSEEAVCCSFEAMTNLKYDDYRGGSKNEN